jgi:hypothetical protein
VTQNLRSDAVDKVQVFDKKSDQATFTGIDDGEKIKTINLELKEDAKKGYFGKVEVGSDFDRFRKGRAMINAFKGKQKIAAFVTNDNSRFESLNWEERSQFGEDLNRTTEVQDDGSTWTTSSGDYFSNGQGFPNQTTGGLLFSKKWAQDKQNFNGTYQFNQLNVTGGRTGFEKTILPQGDTSFTNSYTTNFDNQAHRSRAKLVHEWTIDSSSSLKATINGSYNKNQSFEANQNNTINEGNRKLNEASRTLSNDESKTTVAANVFYRKRFKKKGRTISLSVDVEKTDIKSDGFLKANNIFYTINQPAFVLPTDQNKTNVEDRLSYKAKAVYTEPLGKDYFLESNVLYSRGNNEANRTTLEKLPGGVKYENRIDTLSNFFSFNTRNVQGGASIKYNGKKFQWSLGTDLGSVRFAQDDRLRNFTRSLSFTNFLPRASVKFIRNKQSSVNLTYNGSTQNPTLNNVQPIINNIDPLNITVGNPDLQQEFRHNFNVNFNDYKVLKNRSIWLGGGLTLTDNAIANASFIDSSGKRINKAVNVDGNFSMWMWSNYGFDLFEGINFGFTFSPNINRNVNFINGKRNTTTNYQWRFGIQTSYWGDKIYNFWINIEPAYNIASSTINPTDVKYWSLNSYPNFGLKFKKLKLYLDLEGEMRWFQKAGAFAIGRDVYQLNASIKKTFLKKEELELKLYINDVFNQAQGVDRSISSNFISEDVSQVIQRFFMFSLTWNFNHSNAQAAK